jgi:thiamine biosynthesis lipoprotein
MSIHRFAHEAMATVFELRCDHDDGRYAGQAAVEAFALVDRLEQLLSRFVANSDVSRVNALARGEATRVSPAALECLEIARHMHEVTGGAFDVSLGSGLGRLELDAEAFSVRAREAGVQLDLGGIGKGYAVDRVSELLEDWGISRALVHGGFSSVRALEPPRDEGGWALALRGPGPEPLLLASLSVARRAFSASGTQKGDHIRDPRSGRPAGARVAWVAVPTVAAGPSPAALAETLSTAFMLLSVDEIRSLCRAEPAIEAWVVLDPGERDPDAAPVLHVSGRPFVPEGPEIRGA